MGIKVNMAGVKDNSDPIPIGPYVVAITKVTPGEGAKGPYIGWEFTVQEGEFSGRKLWTNTSFSEASLWRLKQLLEAFSGEKLPNTEIDIEPEKMLGKKAIALVAIANGQDDQPRNEIKKFTKYIAGAGGAAPADAPPKRRI